MQPLLAVKRAPGELLDYATRLLMAQLQIIHDIEIADPGEEAAEFEVDVFFNAVGTDSDDFGLTVPTLGLATTSDGTINILALDMFHGITEGYAIICVSDCVSRKFHK